jgi:hypothetical protein
MFDSSFANLVLRFLGPQFTILSKKYLYLRVVVSAFATTVLESRDSSYDSKLTVWNFVSPQSLRSMHALMPLLSDVSCGINFPQHLWFKQSVLASNLLRIVEQ